MKACGVCCKLSDHRMPFCKLPFLPSLDTSNPLWRKLLLRVLMNLNFLLSLHGWKIR
jgi:hypothetical protein